MSNALKALFFVSILVSSGLILPFTFAQNATLTLSPLKQLKNGISAYDVKCEQGLVLVMKTSDNSPACVKGQTAQRLVERGWGIIPSFTQSQQFITKEDAISVVKEAYNQTASVIPADTYFAYMKYNDTENGNPKFTLYLIEQHNIILQNKDRTIVFDKYQRYLSDKTVDRNVWVIIFSQGGGPINFEYYVDAKTKELIGIYNSCPFCSRS